MISNNEKLSNKFFKLKNADFYFKTGCCEEDHFSASINCEIVDYSGFSRHLSNTVILKNTMYIKITYGFQANLIEIPESEFYENLANRITAFIIKANLQTSTGTIELDFNATEERRALYRKIKIPLIIRETIL